MPTAPPPRAPRSRSDRISFRDQLGALKSLPRFLQMIWETNKWMTLGSLILRVVKAAIPVTMLWLGKLIIDAIIGLIATGGGDMSYLWLLVGIELTLAVFSDVINRITTLLDSLLGDLFSNATSIKLIEHAARLDLYQFEDASFYDKLERARTQTVGRVVLLSQILAQFQDVITVLFLAGGLIAFNPWLLLILLIAVIPAFLGEAHFNERTYSLSRGWTPERRELDYLRYIGASDETAKEIKIFNLADFLANRFREVSDRYYEANKRLAIKRASWGSLLSAVGILAYYGAYVFIIIRTVGGILTVGDLTFLAGSFERMRGLLQSIMTRFTQIAEGSLYLQDLFDFFEIEPTIQQNEKRKPVPKPIRQGFTFENVGFQYLHSDRWAVRHVSFTLKPGEKLALVGENGAGKTTLMKLLARLYDPTEGRILLDGVDLKAYDLQDLRREIGIIFQDYVRFQLNVSENIAVGKIDALNEKERIRSSAKKSLARDVIDRLPDGYEQMLGKRFEGGVELSGGEWQKVALARAYMRDAQLLILDEPTSALDARAEHEVFKRFSELIEGRSAVLISHRFSTVRMADRIVFLEQGEIRESGTHEELLEQGGLYAELFRLQAMGYV